MKILKIIFNGIPILKEEFEIDFYASQKVSDDKNEMLSHVFGNIYTNNILTFIGLNASGKTTTLKLISFVMGLLKNENINSMKYKSIFSGLKQDEEASITTFFCEKEETKIYKLTTKIKKYKNDQNKSIYKITDETLSSKKFSSVRSKNSLFDFEEKNIVEKREKNNMYLLDDVSIIVGYNKKRETIISSFDSIDWTNSNGIRMIGDLPTEIISYLDPSIEYLNCKKVSNSNDDSSKDNFEVKLKFYNKKEMSLNSVFDINKYLSSGTIKGINIFVLAMVALKKGSYFIVDELENHFNIEIVNTLINFFNDKKINVSGATLVFTTHYIELIDVLERNDCINIVRNNGLIENSNLSTLLKRSDKNKSDWFKSGYLDYTTPSYNKYMQLKRVFLDVDASGETYE